MNLDMFYYDGNVISLVTFFIRWEYRNHNGNLSLLKLSNRKKKILHVFHIQFVIVVIFKNEVAINFSSLQNVEVLFFIYFTYIIFIFLATCRKQTIMMTKFNAHQVR